MDIVFSILLTTILCGLMLVARFFERSWLSPGFIFTSIWTGNIVIGLFIICEWEYIPYGILWVIVSCLAVQTGCLIGVDLAKKVFRDARNSRLQQAKPIFSGLKVMVIGTIIIASISIPYAVICTGNSPSDLLSLSSISKMSSINKINYGHGTMRQGTIEWVMLVFAYLGPFLGGILFKSACNWKDKFISLLPVLLISMSSALYGSRMGVLYGGGFWIGSYLAISIFYRPLSGGRVFLKVVALMFILISGLALLVMLIRYREITAINILTLKERAIGGIQFFPGFAKWLNVEGGKYCIPETFGFITFESFFRHAGMSTLFQNYDIYRDINVGFSSTNILTIFRGLIQDYSLFGALVFLFIFGILGGFSYCKVRIGKKNYIPILSIVYSIIIISVAFSPFTYTAPTVAMFLFFGCLCFPKIGLGATIFRYRSV